MATFTPHIYNGQARIQFQYDQNHFLTVSIQTPNLHIRSMVESDLSHCIQLFGDQTVMAKLGTGETRSAEKVQEAFARYMKARQENNPYDRLAVFSKDNEFLGVITLTKTDVDGVAELSGAGFSDYWNKGYGAEAATTIISEYAPATVKEGYTIGGKPLSSIVATARPDNPGSWKILERLGMQPVKEEVKYGGIRKFYSINIPQT